MKIQFRQSGGFAGIVRGCNLDTAAMKDIDGKRLEMLARACTYSPGVSKAGADLMNYEIEIQDGNQQHRLTADDMTLTPELEQFVEHLIEFATPQSIN